MKISLKSRFFKLIIFLIFASLFFIAGMQFNTLGAKKDLLVKSVDINVYEEAFNGISQMLSQNTLVVYEIAEGLINSWIKSQALGLESSAIMEEIFSNLENNGTKSSLIEKNAKIESGLKSLKNYPFQYREAYKILEETYLVYSQFYKFTLNPSGSLVLYSEKIAEFEGDLAKKFSRLNLHAPRAIGNSSRIAEKQPLSSNGQGIKEQDPLPAGIEGILGKNMEEVEKMIGPAYSEACSQVTNDRQKEYKYEGQKVTVYYKNGLVTGLSR